jgi:hypothetical protein
MLIIIKTDKTKIMNLLPNVVTFVMLNNVTMLLLFVILQPTTEEFTIEKQ